MINGLVRLDSGKVFIGGNNISTEDIVEFRRSIDYSIQGNILFPHLTVEENIAYVPNLLNKDNKGKTENAVKNGFLLLDLMKNFFNVILMNVQVVKNKE